MLLFFLLPFLFFFSTPVPFLTFIDFFVFVVIVIEMNDMFCENYWTPRGPPGELYPDVSSKDAPVPPDLPVPKCDCGRPTDVMQSRHPETATRCFYTYSSFSVSICCFRLCC